MNYNKNEDKLNELIRSTMEITDAPSKELNNRLKASLYQQEAVMKSSVKTRGVSLWYVPMVLNFITFSLFAVLALMVISNPYFSVFIASLCGYIAVVGIILTIAGVKRTNMKDDIIVYIEKRGVIA